MQQRFRLDRPAGWAYLAFGVAACRPAVPRLVPSTVVSVSAEQVGRWVEASAPRQRTLHRFKWSFRKERSGTGGRGSARIAAPDSMRFDVAGPLGAGRSSAVVIGDSARWVDPEKSIRNLVPEYPLLWAMFGVARWPDSGAALLGIEEGGRTAWEYAGVRDTVAYLRTEGKPVRFLTEVRRAGRVVGRVETTLAEDGQPLRARLMVPKPAARLDITFYSSTSTADFPPDIWLPRQP